MSLTRKNGRSLTVRCNALIFYLLLFPVFMSFQFTCVHYLIRLCKHIFKLVDICYMFTNTAYTNADLKLVTCKLVIYPKTVVEKIVQDSCRYSRYSLSPQTHRRLPLHISRYFLSMPKLRLRSLLLQYHRCYGQNYHLSF